MTTAVAPRILGCEAARLSTPPLRRLTRSTSKGFEVADFAEQVLGEPLLPWQKWLAVHALELTPAAAGRRYRFATVLALCGRQNGKTSLLRTVALWRLYRTGAQLVLGAAQSLDVAREAWSKSVAAAQDIAALAVEVDRVRQANGEQELRLLSGARYKIAAATRGAARGLSVDLLILDELREQQSWDAWGALSKTTMARPFGQTWAISNAGDDRSVVLNHLREAALAGKDPSIGLFEWSAPEGCDLDDVRGWAAANPGLGRTVEESRIRSAMGTDPPAVFRTEILCQRVDQMDGAVDLAAWRACADPHGELDVTRARVAACVDVAPDGRHVALAVAGLLEDGRVRVEIAAAWESTDLARRGRAVRAEEPLPTLTQVLGRLAPATVAWFPSGPAAGLGPDLRALGVRDIKGGEVAEACMGYSDLVMGRQVVHSSDPLLNAHTAAAQKYHQGDGWRFARRGAGQHAGNISALYAAAGAVHAVRTLPAAVPLPKSQVW